VREEIVKRKNAFSKDLKVGGHASEITPESDSLLFNQVCVINISLTSFDTIKSAQHDVLLYRERTDIKALLGTECLTGCERDVRGMRFTVTGEGRGGAMQDVRRDEITTVARAHLVARTKAKHMDHVRVVRQDEGVKE